MDIKKLTARLAVSQQVAVSDLQAIKTAGFRAVVCKEMEAAVHLRRNFIVQFFGIPFLPALTSDTDRPVLR